MQTGEEEFLYVCGRLYEKCGGACRRERAISLGRVERATNQNATKLRRKSTPGAAGVSVWGVVVSPGEFRR